MQKALVRLFMVGLTFCSANARAQTPPETFTSYINSCKDKLAFTDANMAAIAGSLNCTKGVLFAPNALGPPNPLGAEVNDYMGYARVTDDVDLVFACRWLTNGTGTASQFTAPPFVAARSVEMIINNRKNGNTCLFEAQSTSPIAGHTPVALVSPTAAGAANFWELPVQIDIATPCTKCHVAGPYIASPRIAPFLAQFGLLNNGHDTFGLTRDAQSNIVGNYHLVGSTFSKNLTTLAANFNVPAASTCTEGCHSIGSNSDLSDMTDGVSGNVLLPSILSVIDNSGTGRPEISVTTAGVMKPYADTSHYRWINLDTSGDGVESENFASAKTASTTLVPKLLQYCAAPGALEAHAVGIPVDLSFNTVQLGQFSDRLKTFNLKEGLLCSNADQETGQSCHDYAVRYLCSANTGVNTVNINPVWSDWYNTDSPANDGDHEERSRHQNICGGATPIGIEAAMVTSGGGKAVYAMGPNDRLARFSPYGLTCNNSEQVDGKCSNYVARFAACTTAPPATIRALTNVYAAGKQLTAASSSLVKGQSHNNGWNTQAWTIEPVANTEYVRLKNTSTANNVATTVFLNVQSDGVTVGTAALNNTATSEMWSVEPISGSNHFRLKNLSSGKYLTMADPASFPNSPDYLPIYSQALNTGWTSQRWIVQ